MSWQPSPEGLQRVLNVLRLSQSPLNEIRHQVDQEIKALNQVPDFFSYLIFVFARMQDEDEATRSVAGILLKNNLAIYFDSIDRSVLEVIKQESLSCVGDTSHLVRATAGIIITSIANRGTLASWPELLPSLVELLSSTNYNCCEGAISTLHKICEDVQRELESDVFAGTLNGMLHKFIEYFHHESPKVRSHALGCVNQFIIGNSQALLPLLDVFIERLYKLAEDKDPTVRKNVCQALVLLMDSCASQLMPQMPSIINYMLMSTQDTDDNVALEACEFWLVLVDEPGVKEVLRPFLGHLLPVLLNAMRYSEMDIITLHGDVEDDANEVDNPQNIAPYFARARTHGAHASSGNAHGEGAGTGSDEEGKDDDEDDDDDDDDDQTDWNLRKCSAAALDVVAGVYLDEILPILLPLLRDVLTSPEWDRKESGILALGAISDGCLNGMKAHLPELVPFLLQSLSDPKALVRSIGCWTLSRYCSWIVENARNGTDYTLFEQLVRELLRRILDNNKRVQEAACSAFATLEEESGALLVPFLNEVLPTLVMAFNKYQHNNLLILYDAIGTLAESVGENLNRPEYVQCLMEPLIAKWNTLRDDDDDLFPLLECLSSVAVALRMGFAPFAEPIYKRCITLIEKTLLEETVYMQDPDTYEEPKKDFMIIALDLLSGLAEGLEGSVESLVAGSSILSLLYSSMQNETPEVRQSSFALLGDFSKTCFVHVEPYVGQFLPVLAAHLDPTYPAVCNNAAWAIGELALQIGNKIEPFLPSMVDPLIQIMVRDRSPKTLIENTAITLGRLGYACPTVVAPQLQLFLHPWCISMRNIRDNEEKDTAFRGLCAMIKQNPYGAIPHFIFFCDAVNSWQSPKEDLRAEFYEILQGFKTTIADKWQQYFISFPVQLRDSLAAKYDL